MENRRMNPGSQIKQFFTEEIRAAAALPEGSETERVLRAFATVPREDHVGAGPWLLRSPLFGMASRRTPDANPSHLYHNVLIALDEEQGINIGDPSMWARFFARTSITQGSSVLQVGAGSGYYTAILAELVGKHGRVLATETNGNLADFATDALDDRRNVSFRKGNGATDIDAEDGPFDLVVAFAGVTHPARSWINCLKPDGRMLIPLTNESWWGAMALLERDGMDFNATTLGRCGFFPCLGARDAQTAERIGLLWSEPSRLSDAKFRILTGERATHFEVDGHRF